LRRFWFRAAPLTLAADVRFVNFHRAVKQGGSFYHRLADAVGSASIACLEKSVAWTILSLPKKYFA
jgi:hypothetical protein